MSRPLVDDEGQELDPDVLGPCGCVDYHMADCPLVTGSYGPSTKQGVYDLLGHIPVDDWPDSREE
jgi:hypothetical protein